jgi:hypothetical protein
MKKSYFSALSRYAAMLIFITVLLTGTMVSAQCPMCKHNIESSLKIKDAKKTGLGLNSGIILLMAMPYAIVGTIGVLWYRNSKYRKARRINMEA